MIQEDKELLIRDLCARLPYGVKVHAKYTDQTTEVDSIVKMIDDDGDVGIEVTCDTGLAWTYIQIDNVKPYLFPLSSMTEEQKQEYTYIVNYLSPDDTDNWKEGEFVYVDQMSELMHFFYKNHLDFRGLIKQDLALDATGLNVY